VERLMISQTSRRVSICLLAIALLIAAGGCGESATLRVENNWPTPLFPAVAPLIIDGVFALNAYNYLGPVDTIPPTEHRLFFFVPGTYNFYLTADDPDYDNCFRVYSLEDISLVSTASVTFAINDTTEYYSYGDGCPTEEVP
jgi:hypothetical protein